MDAYCLEQTGMALADFRARYLVEEPQDVYKRQVLEDAYEHYDQEDSPLYPRELLRELLLGLHSMCRGAESVYFLSLIHIWRERASGSWAMKSSQALRGLA